jgi:hypothetical protein
MQEVPDKPTSPDKAPDKGPDEVSDLDAGWGDDDDSGVSERPTVAPPFDLESYAKESAAPSSDVVLNIAKAARGGSIPQAGLPHLGGGFPKGSMEDRIDQLFHDEPHAARQASLGAPSDTAITMPPPPPGPGDISMRLTPATGGVPVVISEQEVAGRSPTSAPSSEPMSRRETPKGFEQVEQARALSAREDVGAGTGTVLSLANMRAPSNLPPRVESDDPVLTLTGVEDARASVADIQTDPMSDMQERFALGDYSGALVMAESLLDENPSHVEAREYAESCRAVLQQMYTAKIGPLDRVPIVEVAREQLRWLSIDHRAGFVLSLVDGVSSLEMILDVSGMPELDALRILFELVQQHIIAIKDE